MITISNVNQKYGNKAILKDINIQIPDGLLTAVVGSNGSGKSTLMKVISKLIPIESGTVIIGQNNIHSDHMDLSKVLSFLHQNHHINLKLKAYDLIAFGRYPYSKGRMKKDDLEMISKMMNYLEIEHLGERFIDTLSGGELQRVLLAMIMVQDTPYILLDEPLNHLDIHYSLDMMKLLKKMIVDFNKTIVIIMHDINMAASFCDYGIALKDGEVIFQGTIDNLMNDQILTHIYNYPITVKTIEDRKICIYQK